MRRTHRLASMLAISTTVAAATSFGTSGGSEAHTRRDLLDVVPIESSAVIGVNIAASRGSAAWSAVESGLTRVMQGRLPARAASCGRIILEEVDSAIIAFPSKAVAGSPTLAVALSGRFDVTRLVACARALPGAGDRAPAAIDGRSMYRLGDSQLFATCMDAETCVVGSRDWIERASALWERKAAARIFTANESLAGLIADTDRRAAIWWALDIPEDFRTMLGGPEERAALSDVTNSHGSVTFRGGAEARIRVGATSEAAAMRLTTGAMDEIAALGADPVIGIDPGLAAPARNARVGVVGREMAVDVALDRTEADNLVASLKRISAGFLATLASAHAK